MHLRLWNAHHIIRHPVRFLLVFIVRLADGKLRLRAGRAKDVANLRLLRKLKGLHQVVDLRACLAHRRRRLLLVCCKGLHLLTNQPYGDMSGAKAECSNPPSLIHTMNTPRVQRAGIPLIKGSDSI